MATPFFIRLSFAEIVDESLIDNNASFFYMPDTFRGRALDLQNQNAVTPALGGEQHCNSTPA